MLIVKSHLITAQTSFLDELEQGVDYGPESDGGLPWEEFIEDNIEEPTEATEPAEPPTEAEPTPRLPIEPPQEEPRGGYDKGDVDILHGEELFVVKSYDNIPMLIKDSVRKHVIKIDYTTRHGVFTANRIVEPHRTFRAKTGNQILLTFDRSAGGIRGFIVGQIKPGAVLYENAFKVRADIMRTRAPSSIVVRKRH